ncbi:adenylate cyclase activating polypeptide 1a isoform X2 [Gadus macrocephalus]|uniref:adenylate cyclase activating polypeptide 1a isoform X2 n=1 Tax=Gadus macrocephalus TaxID=80720 RepID=UPI0028CB83D2|nr:adenylate cyclase activating polypeptide 1a isoform X2 [Gadus macrocephalus]
MIPGSRSFHSGTMLRKALAALFLYGLVTHYRAGCSPAGLLQPDDRLDDDVFDENGESLLRLPFGGNQLTLRSAPSEDVYSLYYPEEERTQRHADGMFNKAYRKALGQLSARKYLHALMAKRVGGGNSMEESEEEPLSKRHSDGVFTDSYSRYRKQKAVKKYLAAVLGKSLEDIDFDQILHEIDLAALPEVRQLLESWLRQISGEFSSTA